MNNGIDQSLAQGFNGVIPFFYSFGLLPDFDVHVYRPGHKTQRLTYTFNKITACVFHVDKRIRCISFETGKLNNCIRGMRYVVCKTKISCLSQKIILQNTQIINNYFNIIRINLKVFIIQR